MSAGTRAALPRPEELARALREDLAWLGDALGARVRDGRPVSPLRGVDRPRTAFRVELEDGRRVKLRRLKTPERAAELARLLERLESVGLPRPLARRGESLVVEWLEGEPLPASPPGPLVSGAAMLLAAIHGIPDFDGEPLPSQQDTEDELCAFDSQLEVLVAAGAIAGGEALRMGATLRRLARPRAARGLAHGDFCGENLIVDPRGRLRVVDNEALHVGLLDLDLARSAARWSLPPDRWRAFLSSYERASGRPVDARGLAGWTLRTLVTSAWYRIRYGLPGVAERVARLRALRDSLGEGAGA